VSLTTDKVNYIYSSYFWKEMRKKHLFDFLSVLCEIVMLVIYLFVIVAEIWWQWKATLGFAKV